MHFPFSLSCKCPTGWLFLTLFKKNLHTYPSWKKYRSHCNIKRFRVPKKVFFYSLNILFIIRARMRLLRFTRCRCCCLHYTVCRQWVFIWGVSSFFSSSFFYIHILQFMYSIMLRLVFNTHECVYVYLHVLFNYSEVGLGWPRRHQDENWSWNNWIRLMYV